MSEEKVIQHSKKALKALKSPDKTWLEKIKELKMHKINAAYVDSNADYLMNTNYFIIDDSRFEGFKSSGYLRLIENQELLKHLVILYSSYMPFERDADMNVFRTRERDYNTYIGIKGTEYSENIGVSKLLNDPAVRYQILRYVFIFDERKRHKLQLAKRLRIMVAEIDEELKK